ncbi:hypothetical protein [Nocardia colli]|uniref:hypothetical protein n=1 Tax=Nocardia colli TaxID=2545717 RepID=UPI001CC3EAFE|nr:hypothetical protein [Nocardia colli]
MAANQCARFSGGAGAEVLPLDYDHIAEASSGQLKRGRYADNAAADNHDVGRFRLVDRHFRPFVPHAWSSTAERTYAGRISWGRSSMYCYLVCRDR